MRAVVEWRAEHGRQRRGDKPFAVMVADLATAHTIAAVDTASARVLSGPERPIMLMARLPNAPIADAVAPHNPDVGVLLATATKLAVLEGLNDFENLGAIFRNAAAFGVDAVLLDPQTADPLYRRSVRVSECLCPD